MSICRHRSELLGADRGRPGEGQRTGGDGGAAVGGGCVREGGAS